MRPEYRPWLPYIPPLGNKIKMCQGGTRDTQLGPHSLHALCIYESSRVYGCTPMFCLVVVRFSKPIPKLGP